MKCGETGALSSHRGISLIASIGQKLQGSCVGFTESAMRNPDLKV